jgi:hypothetical protein
MSETKEEIQYTSYDRNTTPTIQKEILNFLINLGPERETLFYGDITKENYPQICEETVAKIDYTIIATHNKKIVGLSGLLKKRRGMIGKISPFIRGFIVVSHEYQGKRIGSKLTQIETEYLKKKWGFRHNINKIENLQIIKINKKIGVKIVGNDNKLIHSFHPTRSELGIFNPIAFIILRLRYIEYPKLRRILARATGLNVISNFGQPLKTNSSNSTILYSSPSAYLQ